MSPGLGRAHAWPYPTACTSAFAEGGVWVVHTVHGDLYHKFVMEGKQVRVHVSTFFVTLIHYCLDYFEEQSGELETLRCIYPEQEFTEISDNPPCFRVHVQAIDSSDDQEVTGAYQSSDTRVLGKT